MGAFTGVISVAGGIIWTIFAFGITGDREFPGSIFPLFGIIFIIGGIGHVIYNLRNATGRDRYSTFDIVDEGEEPDPLNQRFGRRDVGIPLKITPTEADNEFCPYCGKELEPDFEFCPRCGRDLPGE